MCSFFSSNWNVILGCVWDYCLYYVNFFHYCVTMFYVYYIYCCCVFIIVSWKNTFCWVHPFYIYSDCTCLFIMPLISFFCFLFLFYMFWFKTYLTKTFNLTFPYNLHKTCISTSCRMSNKLFAIHCWITSSMSITSDNNMVSSFVSDCNNLMTILLFEANSYLVIEILGFFYQHEFSFNTWH